VKLCQSVCKGIVAYPLKLDLHTEHKMLWYVKLAPTRTAWAVFKYCGTKTVTLRKKKNEKIDLKFISKETNKIRGNN
jgi:hypothetical protein